jgi:N4-gp56 family major capsid protein
METAKVSIAEQANLELVYGVMNTMDALVATTLYAASDATSTAKGAQTVFGGDAYSTATLETGDILTPDLIAKAVSRLQSTVCKYWDTTEKNSSAVKFPFGLGGQKMMLFVSPSQMEALRLNSQFMNAAEFGARDAILTGSITKYLDVEIITAHNVPAYSNWGGSTLAGHGCILCVAGGQSAVLVYRNDGKPHMFTQFFQRNLEYDFIMEYAYAVAVVHTDSIVKICVSDA